MDSNTITLHTIPIRTDDKENIIRYDASTNSDRLLTRVWNDEVNFVENEVLTILQIGSNGLGHRGVQYLADLLKDNTDHYIEDDGAKHLADALENNTTLTILYLKFNRIGENWMKHIASALEKNKTSKTLGIKPNDIDDVGTVPVVDMLSNNTKEEIVSPSG
ncbi:unnamed protein product [Rotaria sordida]|uniref:Uncharacterized protein n=1 Tax=Rotaria sordida TaxID=392033 RepID=A0A814WTI1_9BILA|nr:unnamed protein product [Rotaria sordida]